MSFMSKLRSRALANRHVIGENVLNTHVCLIAGLSLVVAQLPDERHHGLLPVRLLPPLLRHEARNRRLRVDLPLLWLHLNHGLYVLLAHR